MKKCNKCFLEYNKEYEVCPYCGNIEGNAPKESRYLVPGTILGERYLVGMVVGAGGFGVTYAAWDNVLNQKVAIKEYLPGEFSTRAGGQSQVTVYGGEKTEQFERGKEQFHEESRRLAKFRNIPGIVQIFNSFMENGTVYIVMEFLEGETLDARLKREGKLSEQEAVNIMLPVLQALEEVHKEGILHRDIAPNNIFLTTEGEVKLIDFGAARSATGSHSKSLTVLYKEGYTPEEQYRSRGDQGPWTDVYACAATLYKMLTGKIPPGALERRRKDTLKEPSKNGAKVSKTVDVAILNALNVDVKYRTQSAGEFLKELTGEVKGKKHFVRTIEKKIGKLPLGIKVGTGLVSGMVATFLVLLATGVIRFEIDGFDNFGVPEGKSRVPNIVNKEVEEAQEKLEERVLSIKIVDKQFSEEIPKDRILNQSIKPGSIAEQGETVEVVVSGGTKNLENGYELENGETFVPDVQYKGLEEALWLIEKAKLTGEIRYKIDENVEEGKIIEQELEAGSIAKEGDVLVFYLNGEEPMNEEEEIVEEIEEEIQEEVQEPIVEVEVAVEGFDVSKSSELITYINQYRAAAGVAELTWDSGLEGLANEAAYTWSYNNSALVMVPSNDYHLIGRWTNTAITAQREVYDWIEGSASSKAAILLDAKYTRMAGACYYRPDAEYKYLWAVALR